MISLPERYLVPFIREDLRDKMVFLGGPRQVGKTTLGNYLGEHAYPRFRYLTWDDPQDKKDILSLKFDADVPFIIFDELHKYRHWKNLIKGFYDKQKERFQILVTGSARLDIYRRGGDSLMGRYHYYRLHPFSVKEALGEKTTYEIFKPLHFKSAHQASADIFSALFTFGGFPEPFSKQSVRTLRRWHNERIDRIVREDIRDIELIRDLSRLEILTSILPSKVGSLFSLNSLRQDLQVTHKTVMTWVEILERFYYHFRIYPFSGKTIKSLRKEPKIYLMDWSPIEDPGIRLENMVASHLLKFTHFLHDTEGYKAELYYLRDIEQREVDFLVTLNKKPWFAVEVKQTQQELARPLNYFGERLKIPFLYQVIATEKIDIIQDNVRIMSASKFLNGLV